MQITTKTLMLPTPEQLDSIYRDLGMTEAKFEADVKTIAEWMRKQPHLPDPEVDERRIRLFLICCKNSMEKTKNTLDQYYTIKSKMPEFFANRDPSSPSILKMMNIMYYIPLPRLTKECRRVSLCRLKISENDSFNFASFVKAVTMTSDIRLSKLDTFKKEICIVDLKHLTVYNVTAILPLIQKFLYCSLNAYPIYFHQVHVCNLPSYAMTLMNIILDMLQKKTNIKLYIHKDIEELKEHLSEDVLPLDYGGTLPKTSDELAQDWQEELIKHKEWFLSQNSIVCDESKRLKKSTLDSNMLTGVEGSFRRLEVD